MDLIKLPDLKKIEVVDFSLYSQKPTFTYEFVKGINLIIGGNGLGKTTFINLIKYALIGNYTQVTDVRTYKENKIEKRLSLDPYYFRNRMDDKYPNNESAKVILTFSVDKTLIKVTRNLYELQIEEVFVECNDESYYLSGEVISQRKYDSIPRSETETRKRYLQCIYEETVTKMCNFSDFDSAIFFIHDILSFDEKRQTLFWDKNIQLPLLSKHFNPPELDKEIEELKREVKYYDSLSRHKQEDIRAITKVLKRKENLNSNIEKNKDSLLLNYSKLKNSLNSLIVKKEKTNEKLSIENKYLKDLLSKKNRLMNEIAAIEEKLSEYRSSIYEEIWSNLNPKYEIYLKNISINKTCPLCNNDIINDMILERIKNNKCILCEHELDSKKRCNNIEEEKLEKEMNVVLATKQNIEKNILNRKNTIRNLERQVNETELEIAKTKDLIYSYQKTLETQSENNSDGDESLNIIMDELNDLEKEKNNFIEIRDNLKSKLDKKIEFMESKILHSTKDISALFSKYANNFLGLNTKLIYDMNPNEKQKMYIPFIEDSPRYTSDSLSESQSFFIDQSFRFGIIDFFNPNKDNSAFYICETPDSSLDISYELNAADIFIEFSNKPNTFIMTSNFNNSKFIEYIIKNSNKLNHLNLLNIGNTTKVQFENEELNSLSKNIEVMISEKNKQY